MICERCGKETNTHKTSRFNTQEICLECEEIERKHPDYQKARDVENEAVKLGNHWFEGIGLPDDLKKKVIVGLRVGLKPQQMRDLAKAVQEITEWVIKERPHYKVVDYIFTVGNWGNLALNADIYVKPFDVFLIYGMDDNTNNFEFSNFMNILKIRHCNVKVECIPLKND